MADISEYGAIVTGGTSGLGAAVAEALAGARAEVAIVGRNSDAGRAIAAQGFGRIRFTQADVTDPQAVHDAVELAARAPLGLRVAVSAAGTAIVQKTVGRDGAHPVESFESVMQTNLFGAFHLIRSAAECMMRNEPDSDGQRGVIILTSSVAALEGQMGQLAYAASKGGVASMVLPAARDLARDGIRVVGIMPGMFDTPFMDVLTPEVKDALEATVPFPKRFGRPEEYASLVLEIVRNRMINGENIRLDGALRLPPR